MTGMKNVFFSNSGAESNEGAIKAARKYSFTKYGENRNRIITLKNKYATTFADIEEGITDTRKTLYKMLGDLTGSVSDMEGLAEFRKSLEV